MANFYLPLLIFACLALLSVNAATVKRSVNSPRINDDRITMAKLVREVRKEPGDFYDYHLLSMLLIRGAIGDPMYDITDEKISEECLKTAKVTVTMKMQLTIGKEMDTVLNTAISDSYYDFKKAKELKHPLEFVCSKLEKAIAEKPHLMVAREKALKNLLPGFSGGGRPPYAKKLFTSRAQVAMFMMKKLTVPEIARYITDEEFQNQLDETAAYSTRTHLLVKSIVAIAGKEQFAQSMQSTYEKSLDEIVPRISANVKIADLLLADEKTFWFLPEVLKIFYRNISKDPVLKKELEDTAAVLGKDAYEADLDFSRI